MATAIPDPVCQLGEATFDAFRRCQTASFNQVELADLGMRLLGVHLALHALTIETKSPPGLKTCMDALAEIVEKLNVCIESEQSDKCGNDALQRSVRAKFPNCSDGSERIRILREELKSQFAELLKLASEETHRGLEKLQDQLQNMQSCFFFYKFRNEVLTKYQAVLQEFGSPLCSGSAFRSSKSFSSVLPKTQEFLTTVLHTGSHSLGNRASSIDWASTKAQNIPPEELRISKKELGHGTYGTVFSARWYDVPCAVKMLMKGSFERMVAEADLHFRFHCDHVVEMKGVSGPQGGSNELWIVMELMEMSLAKFLNKQYDNLEPIVLVDIAQQLAKGIHQLHSLYNVVHQDLKLSNVLLKRDAIHDCGWVAKLSDFGLSQEHRAISMSLDPHIDKAATGSNPAVGTLSTMAPETLLGHGNGRKSDMYGFGIMLWELLHGKFAWNTLTREGITAAVIGGVRPPFSSNPWPERLDEVVWMDLCELISRCWAQTYEARPTFEVVIAELGELLQRMKHKPIADLEGILTTVRELRNETSRQTSGRSLSEVLAARIASNVVPYMRPDICIGVLTSSLREIQDPSLRVEVLDALTFLAIDSVYAEAIATYGGIELLLDLIRSGSEEVIEKAVNALRNMAVFPANREAIVQKGVLPVLIGLLPNGYKQSIRESAAGCLQSLAIDPGNKIRIASEGGIEALVALLTDGTDKGKELAAGALRTLAVDLNNMVAIASAGGIPPLIQLLRTGTMECMKNAAGALRNLAANTQNKVLIAQSGGIQPLIELLCNGNEEAKEKAAGALSNLARNHHNKTLIGDAGGIETLIDLICNDQAGAQEKAAGALQNLACDHQQNIRRIRDAGGVAALEALARTGSGRARRKAGDALYNLRL